MEIRLHFKGNMLVLGGGAREQRTNLSKSQRFADSSSNPYSIVMKLYRQRLATFFAGKFSDSNVPKF